MASEGGGCTDIACGTIGSTERNDTIGWREDYTRIVKTAAITTPTVRLAHRLIRRTISEDGVARVRREGTRVI
jgi:hypothetical protein